jgi:hypothetical protein
LWAAAVGSGVHAASTSVHRGRCPALSSSSIASGMEAVLQDALDLLEQVAISLR